MTESQRTREMSFAELRERLQRHRGGEVEIFTDDGETASGHVYTTIENDVVVVEDPGEMVGIHVIALNKIDRVVWGAIPRAFLE